MSLLSSLLSPVTCASASAAAALLLALPRRRLSSTAASDQGREGEARGSLAEVKVNLPPAEAMKAREEDKAGRQARMIVVIVVNEHLSCFSRRPSALLICKVNWQA